MKKNIRGFAILTCLCLFTLCLLPVRAAEEEDPSASTLQTDRELTLPSPMTVSCGDVIELTYGCLGTEDISSDDEAVFTFTSSDPEILSLTETGDGKLTVTALGKGQAVIYVEVAASEHYYEKSGEIPVTVKTGLATPAFKDNHLLSNGIYLSWDSVYGAKSYLIEKKSGSGAYKSYKTLEAADKPSFTDTNVTEGESYAYRIRACKDKDESDTVTAKFIFIKPPVLTVRSDESGIVLDWSRTEGSAGYLLYRKSGNGAYSLIFSTTYAGETGYTDKKAKNAVAYTYMVKTKNGSYVSAASAAKTYARLNAPSIKSFKRKNATKMTLTWKKQSGVAGYEIQYGRNALFLGVKKAVVRSASKVSYTATKLLKNRTYWARIRSYRKIGGVKYYSPWTVTANVYQKKTLTTTQLKKGQKVLDINALAKQGVKGHSILEGSCSDGTCSYYLLARESTKTCIIVKIRQSDRTLIKVSGALPLDHGNDMTYDKAKKQLLIIHSTGDDPKRLTKVDPSTLKVLTATHVSIPTKLAGGSLKNSLEATAFSAIAYSDKRKSYAVLLSHNYNFVILNSDLRPTRYVTVNKKLNYTIQGIDATDDYILIAQSPKKKSQYNILTVYTWNGKFVCRMNVKKGYEIESVYHIGSRFYASFYRSYTVKINGKKVSRRAGYVYRLNFK